jgi:hypothetical protein
MRKAAAVRHGDPTTTRGVVLAYSSTIHDHGKKVALSGDEATCGNCEGTFKIFGTGQGMSQKGRCVVVDGDLVLCPCKRNRVIVGSNPGIFLKTNNGSASANVASDAQSTPSVVHDEQYTLLDDARRPLANVHYRIVTDTGQVFTGVTNAVGQTQRVSTQGSSRLQLQVEKQ